MADIMHASVSERLKQETLANHTSIEDMLQPSLASIRNHEHYARVLNAFYGYFYPLWERIGQFISTDILPDIAERRTTELILKDLDALKMPVQGIKEASRLPAISSVDEALGAMYVMEGSTLGGRYISKMLLKNTDADLVADQVHFFSGYKEETGAKWTGFKTALDTKVQNPDAAVRAANETFELMESWMKENI